MQEDGGSNGVLQARVTELALNLVAPALAWVGKSLKEASND